VRDDPTCQYENLEASADETKFFGLFGSQCGNVTACSASLNTCTHEVANRTAAGSKNNTVRCGAVDQAVKCLSTALNSDICVRVNQTQRQDDKKLVAEYTQMCGKPDLCEAGLKACISPVEDISNNPDSAKVQDCPIIQQAVTCLDGFAGTPTCKIFNATINKAEQAIKQTLNGFCSDPQACDQSITKCKKDYQNIPKTAGTAQRCGVVSLAVTCINLALKSPACGKASPQIKDEDLALSKEYTDKCGGVNECDKDLEICIKPLAIIAGDSDSQKAQDCPILSAGVKCLDRVLGTPICTLFKTNTETALKPIRAKEATLCGAASLLQASVLAVVLSVLAHVFKF